MRPGIASLLVLGLAACGTWAPTFGSVLEAGKDVDGDGHADFAIGDPDLGAVWICSGRRGDGTSDWAVGAPGRRLMRPGYAVVLSGRGAREILRVEGATSGAGSGFSVAGVEDLDGDGWPEVVALDESYGISAGRLYVWSPRDDRLLFAIDGPGDWHFGVSAALLGDLDGDGWAELAVGGNGTWAHEDAQVHVVSLGEARILRRHVRLAFGPLAIGLASRLRRTNLELPR
jgi:hypothetical protein